MTPRFPVLHASPTRRPAQPAKGLALLGPEGGTCAPGAPAWFHGVLVVSCGPEEAERWLRSIFVTAQGEDDSTPRIAPLVRADRPLLGPPPAPRDGTLVLDFQFDLAEVLEADVVEDGHFVHASAGLHRSNVVHLRARDAAPAAAPAGTGLAPVDALAAAYAHARLRQWDGATARFAEALADEALRADLDRGCLFHAACAASLAAAGAAGEARAARAQEGLAWLKEDVERRRAALQRRLAGDVEREVAGALSPEQRASEEALRASVVAHLRAARADEPDLATLRESEFTAIFG